MARNGRQVLAPASGPPPARLDDERVLTDDGLWLAAQSTGAGPPVLVCNGIGLTVHVLERLVGHLRARNRVVCWDYRGSEGSPLPAPDADVSMARHARDAALVMDHFGLERAAVVAWSMGVPVALELARMAPSRVAGLAALFGSAGPPFRADLPPWAADAIELWWAAAAKVPRLANHLVRLGEAFPPLAWLVCRSVRFAGARTPRHTFQRCVRDHAASEPAAYLRMLRHLVEHDARDVLARLRCPVVVVAGDGDWVTPPAAASEMAARTAGARLVVLPHTSHFGILEHGPALWEPLDEWLARVG